MSRSKLCLLILICFFLTIQIVDTIGQNRRGVLVYEVQSIYGYTWKDKLAECSAGKNDSIQIQVDKVKNEIEQFLLNKSKQERDSLKVHPKWEYHFDKKKGQVYLAS